MRTPAVTVAVIAGLMLAAAPGPPVRDPFAPGSVPATALPDGAVPPADVDGNFVLGPTHAAPAGLTPPPAAGRGTVVDFTMASADSPTYPGVARDPTTRGLATRPAPYTRTVSVYVPAGYRPGTPAPLLVGCDGPDPLLFATLDAQIAAGRVPPIVAVSIGNGGGNGPASERGLEYDTVSGRYAEFVQREVLPRVESRCHVTISRDPDARAATGCSSGGSCALAMAWFHPEWYHRVLTYSGTYVSQQWPPDPATPHGAWAFHERLIPDAPRKPLRLWLEVGDRDLFNPATPGDRLHDWVAANEAMAGVLAAKGYPYQFVFARHAGHCDGGVKRQTLAEALEYVWHGYRAAR